MTPKEMALLLAQALDSKKGKDIRVLETDSVTTLADYFVLCTGTSAPQLKALAAQRMFGPAAYFRVVNPSLNAAYIRATEILADWRRRGEPLLEGKN